MKRDIDRIIETLSKEFSALRVVQMSKVHPADDDGLWWFRLPGKVKNIQAESPSGNCPFIVESSDDKSSLDAITCNSIEEVTHTIRAYLVGLQQEP